MAETALTPWDDGALEAGCTCQPRDGEPEDNRTWPDWLVEGCPIHDTPEIFAGGEGDA